MNYIYPESTKRYRQNMVYHKPTAMGIISSPALIDWSVPITKNARIEYRDYKPDWLENNRNANHVLNVSALPDILIISK